MLRIISAVRLLSRFGTWCAGALVLLAAIAITIDVVVRKLFSITLASGSLSELSGYALALAVSWSAALTLIDRAHVRIDTLQTLLGPRARSALDALSLLLFGGAFALLAVKAWQVALRSMELGSTSMTPLATPVAIPQTLWALGWSVTVLAAALLSAAVLRSLLRGDLQTVQRLAGSRSVEEDLADHREEHGGGPSARAPAEREAAR